jgi:hypothetical protein
MVFCVLWCAFSMPAADLSLFRFHNFFNFASQHTRDITSTYTYKSFHGMKTRRTTSGS